MKTLCMASMTIMLIMISSAIALGQTDDSEITLTETAAKLNRLTADSIEALLIRPACFEFAGSPDQYDNVHDFPVVSGGITLATKLFMPEGDGPWPAVILVPGGFNETELIMRAPNYEAPRLARCGYAAVVYYKRGLGPSGGSYADATYDDFIDDVGNIAKQLSELPRIDASRIGASGGSGGAFVASIAAARYPEISFAINKSGPIVPQEEAGNFNINHALRSRGYADSLVDQVLPLWKRHHAAWAGSDTAALEAVAEEILDMRERYDFFLLPTPYNEVFTDSNLVFLWPQFRSASRDFITEMETMKDKYLCIYGENDPIVPVAPSVKNIDRLMNLSGNREYTVVVLPDVGHSFEYPDSGRQIPVIRIVINWLNANIGRGDTR